MQVTLPAWSRKPIRARETRWSSGRLREDQALAALYSVRHRAGVAPGRSDAGVVDPFGRYAGCLIATSFGLVFIVANTGELPGACSATLRVIGVVVAVVLAVGSVRQCRSSAAGIADGRAGDVRAGGRWQSFDRRYWAVVAAEVIALAAGLVIINGVLAAPAFGVAWIALVVGLHFFGLAAIWRLPLFNVLGAALAVFGAAGFIAGALGASAAIIGVVSGVTSGGALFMMVAEALRRGERYAAGHAPLKR